MNKINLLFAIINYFMRLVIFVKFQYKGIFNLHLHMFEIIPILKVPLGVAAMTEVCQTILKAPRFRKTDIRILSYNESSPE